MKNEIDFLYELVQYLVNFIPCCNLAQLNLLLAQHRHNARLAGFASNEPNPFTTDPVTTIQPNTTQSVAAAASSIAGPIGNYSNFNVQADQNYKLPYSDQTIASALGAIRSLLPSIDTLAQSSAVSSTSAAATEASRSIKSPLTTMDTTQSFNSVFSELNTLSSAAHVRRTEEQSTSQQVGQTMATWTHVDEVKPDPARRETWKSPPQTVEDVLQATSDTYLDTAYRQTDNTSDKQVSPNESNLTNFRIEDIVSDGLTNDEDGSIEPPEEKPQIYTLPENATALDVINLWKHGTDQIPPIHKWSASQKLPQKSKISRWRKLMAIFDEKCNGDLEKFKAAYKDINGKIMPVSAILSKHKEDDSVNDSNSDANIPGESQSTVSIHDIIEGGRDNLILPGSCQTGKSRHVYVLPKRINRRKVSALDVIRIWEQGLGNIPPVSSWNPVQKMKQQSKISRWKKIYDIYKIDCHGSFDEFFEKFADEKGDVMSIAAILLRYEKPHSSSESDTSSKRRLSDSTVTRSQFKRQRADDDRLNISQPFVGETSGPVRSDSPIIPYLTPVTT